MDRREEIATIIGEDEFRDSFNGENVTEQDREHCRKLADAILAKLAEPVDLEKYRLDDKELFDSLCEGTLMISFRAVAHAQFSILTPLIASLQAQIEQARQDGRREVVEFIKGYEGKTPNWYSHIQVERYFWQSHLKVWGLQEPEKPVKEE
jgi:hypothetical protein